jgi:hypothetical protein
MDDFTNPNQLLATLRDLLHEFHVTPRGATAALKAVAAAHIMSMLDAALSAGAPLPEAWAKAATTKSPATVKHYLDRPDYGEMAGG